MTVLPFDPALAAAAAGFEIYHLQDRRAFSVAGGASSAGVNVRVLNTEVVPASFGSLLSNQVTLLTGRYLAFVTAPALDADRHRLVWFNDTDTDETLLGGSVFAAAGDSSVTVADAKGPFTIAATKVFELQHFIQSARASNGLGVESNDTDQNDNVYAEVIIIKLP